MRLSRYILPFVATSLLCAADEPAPAAPAVAEINQRVLALENQASQQIAERLAILAFAELTWRATHGDPRDGNDNHFALGQFDLFMSRNIRENSRFLSEVVIEADQDGNTVVDLERCLLAYRPFSELELSAGRYHTHMGWWNATYHHGEWFQPTIGRPAGLEFEDGGGILPVHFIGLAAEKGFSWSAVELKLIAEVGNGRGPAPDPPQVSADANDSKAVNLAFSLSPTAFPDLEFGASFAFDDIPKFTGNSDFPAHGELDEHIAGIYGALQHGPLQSNLEVFTVRHHDPFNGTTTTSRTGYALIAWRCARARHRDLTPYFRADRLVVDDGDSYFGSTDDRTDLHLGLRWDMTSVIAVKLQGTRSTYTFANGDHPRSSGVAVQFSGRF